MSAESELLLSQSDCLMQFPDYSPLPELDDDFSKELPKELLLVEDLECKDDFRPMFSTELNEFSLSLNSAKEAKEAIDSNNGMPLMNDSNTMKNFMVAPMADFSSLQAGISTDKLRDGNQITTGMLMRTYSAPEAFVISNEPILGPNEMSSMFFGMNLEDHSNMQPFQQGSSGLVSTALINSITPEDSCNISSMVQDEKIVRTMGLATNSLSASKKALFNGMFELSTEAPESIHTSKAISGIVGPGIMTTRQDTFASVVPQSIFQISSPISSSASSSLPTSQIMVHDENRNLLPSFQSLAKTLPSVDFKKVADGSSLSSIKSAESDVYQSTGMSCALTQQEVATSTTMQRSQSSHALGQFRALNRLGTCPENFSVPSMDMSPMMGFSGVNPFSTQFQPTNFPTMSDRPPVASMRRVFSTGDLQTFDGNNYYGDQRPNNVERTNSEESPGLRIGHYTFEERKVRLHRYRQKRNERNFSKKIKYACRKTLADSRPRIRGRFARTTDDSGETFSKENGSSHADEYEEGDAVMMMNCNYGTLNNFGSHFWDMAGMRSSASVGSHCNQGTRSLNR